MTSEQQIAANRENAQKSTGPRTPEGKERVRNNAVKHGIFADSVVISGLETIEDYEDLVNELYESLNPQTGLERMLVQKMAMAFWQQRRAARAEVGAVQARMIYSKQRDATQSLDAFETALKQARDPSESYDALNPDPSDVNRARQERRLSAQRKLFSSVLGLQQMGKVLESMIKHLESGPRCPQAIWNLVESDIGNTLDELQSRLAPIAGTPPRVTRDRATGVSFVQFSGEQQQAALVILRAARDVQQEVLGRAQNDKELERAAREARDLVPDSDTVTRLAQYEGFLERKLYKAMEHFNGLRHRRRARSLVLSPGDNARADAAERPLEQFSIPGPDGTGERNG